MRRFTLLTSLLVAASLVAAFLTPASRAADSTTPVLRISDTDLVFNDVAIGQSRSKALTVSNAGGGSLTIGTSVVGGGDATDFAITSTTCKDKTLAAGQSCVIGVTFKPVAASTRVSHLSIPTNVKGCAAYASLAGTGAAQTGPDHAERHPGFSTVCSGPQVVTVPGPSTTTPGTSTTTTTPGGVLGSSESGGAQRCLSKRTVRIHIRAPKGKAIKDGSLTVKTKGRTFSAKKITKGKRKGQYYSDLNFKGLKVGRYEIQIRGKLTDGADFKRERHFVTCTSGRTPSN